MRVVIELTDEQTLDMSAAELTAYYDALFASKMAADGRKAWDMPWSKFIALGGHLGRYWSCVKAGVEAGEAVPVEALMQTYSVAELKFGLGGVGRDKRERAEDVAAKLAKRALRCFI